MPLMLEVPKKETFQLLQSLWGLWHLFLWLLLGKGFFGLSAMVNTVYLRFNAINRDTMKVNEKEQANLDA